MDRSRYPKNWDEIARRVKEKARWRCEQCKQVNNPNSPRTMLTVHHKDGNPGNNDPENLVALCAPCHLRAQKCTHLYDERQGQLELRY